MSAWPMVKLGEVTKVASGGTPKTSIAEYWDGDVPWVTPKDLSNNKKLWISSGSRSITELGLAKSGATLLPSQTVLWSSRAPIGLVAIASNPIATNQGFKSFIPGRKLDSNYLAHFLIQSRAALQNLGVGATFKEVSAQRAAEIQIPLPPLGEQKRIAEMLEQVTLAINIVQHNIENTLSFKKTSQDSIINANSADSTELSQIASIQSGITKGRKTKEDTPLKPVPYMAVSNVKAGRLDLSTVKKIDASEAEIDRYLLKTGDILLTEGGDPDKLGRGSIWRNEIQEAIHQNHIFRVRINPTSNFTSEALMAILESKESKYYFLRSAKQTTGISSINKTQLSATPIPVLDQAQVNEITRLWHDSEQIIALYRQKLALLQELQRSLSARAFAGDL